MHSLRCFYEFGSLLKLPNGASGSEDDHYSTIEVPENSKSTAEAKAVAASKNHSEAERRRRTRINGHLATLRTLFPNTIKTDKASLLTEAVRRVTELKKATAEIAIATENFSNPENNYMCPTELDALKLCYCEGDSGNVKAILCCDDRPELMSDLSMAVRSVEAKVVRAEVATVGGRTKSILWVRVPMEGREAVVETLRKALKVVVDRAALSPGSGQTLLGSKRPRLYRY